MHCYNVRVFIDIPVIPDLDDLQEEELASQIAKAPSYVILNQ